MAISSLIVALLTTLAIVHSAPSFRAQSGDDVHYIENECGKVVPVLKFVLLSRRPSVSSQVTPPCQVTLNNTVGNRLFLVFKDTQMAKKTGNQCVAERVDVYDGPQVSPSKLLSGPSGLCGNDIMAFNSTSQTLTVVYTTRVNMTFGFNSVSTAFHVSDKCSQNEFQCQSSKACIDITLRCNNMPNCGDRSDEMYCGAMNATTESGTTNEPTTHEATTVHLTTSSKNSSVMPYIGNATTIDVTTASGGTTMNITMATDVTAAVMNTSMMTTMNVTMATDATTTAMNTSMMTTANSSSIITTNPSENFTGTTATSHSTSPSGTHTNIVHTTTAPAGSQSNAGAIAGGVIGAILFVIIVGGAIYFYRKRSGEGSAETKPLNN